MPEIMRKALKVLDFRFIFSIYKKKLKKYLHSYRLRQVGEGRLREDEDLFTYMGR